MSINLPCGRGHVFIKFGPDRFSRFDVIGYKQTNRQTNRQIKVFDLKIKILKGIKSFIQYCLLNSMLNYVSKTAIKRLYYFKELKQTASIILKNM